MDCNYWHWDGITTCSGARESEGDKLGRSNRVLQFYPQFYLLFLKFKYLVLSLPSLEMTAIKRNKDLVQQVVD